LVGPLLKVIIAAGCEVGSGNNVGVDDLVPHLKCSAVGNEANATTACAIAVRAFKVSAALTGQTTAASFAVEALIAASPVASIAIAEAVAILSNKVTGPVALDAVPAASALAFRAVTASNASGAFEGTGVVTLFAGSGQPNRVPSEHPETNVRDLFCLKRSSLENRCRQQGIEPNVYGHKGIFARENIGQEGYRAD
jgi:hypothetical protein